MRARMLGTTMNPNFLLQHLMRPPVYNQAISHLVSLQANQDVQHTQQLVRTQHMVRAQGLVRTQHMVHAQFGAQPSSFPSCVLIALNQLTAGWAWSAGSHTHSIQVSSSPHAFFFFFLSVLNLRDNNSLGMYVL